MIKLIRMADDSKHGGFFVAFFAFMTLISCMNKKADLCGTYRDVENSKHGVFSVCLENEKVFFESEELEPYFSNIERVDLQENRLSVNFEMCSSTSQFERCDHQMIRCKEEGFDSCRDFFTHLNCEFIFQTPKNFGEVICRNSKTGELWSRGKFEKCSSAKRLSDGLKECSASVRKPSAF